MIKRPFVPLFGRETGAVVFGLLMLCALRGDVRADSKRIAVLPTPHGGIQPQAVLDSQGALHLLYFKGKAGEGDLFYLRRDPGKEAFSTPIRVNSQPGSAVATGTIRGGQMAIGRKGRIHVAWNGSGKAPKGPENTHPMLYARMNDTGTAFEAQRNLMTATSVLDGGGTVAADGTGNVYVAWHGLAVGSARGEEHRQVWLAHSVDDGQTFAGERPAFAKPTGACGCCGMRAFADRQGTLYLSYRAATAKVHRDMYLLTSKDQGKRFLGTLLQNWQINACPMSSEAFAQGPSGVFTAWETAGQVYFARIDPTTGRAERPHAAPGSGTQRKHPALAVNDRGEVLFVWTEGTGWQRGGALAWQLFDKSGQPAGEKGRIERAVPVWGLAAAIARPDGTFQILH